MKFLDRPFLASRLILRNLDNDTAAEGLIETKHEHTCIKQTNTHLRKHFIANKLVGNI